MRIFVTVGSTKFEPLVQAALSNEALASMAARGYTSLTVQCGESRVDEKALDLNIIKVDVWKFKPSLDDDYASADLVISHAGSGTVLEVLRLGKPLIIVPNPTLLDNHQEELAVRLSDLGYLKVSLPSNLAQSIETINLTALKPFPPQNRAAFSKILDEEMGFSS